MGTYFRRLRARIGPQKACSAAARKLAELFYRMLRDKKAYNDPGEEQYMQRFKEKQVAILQKRAGVMGFNLVPVVNVS
jgi:hypothetical protein